MTAPSPAAGRDAAAVDIVVVGSLNVDLVVHAPRLPLPGETLLGHAFSTDDGGKGANQAIAAARMDGSVAMVGRVGADAHGERLLAALDRAGVARQAVTVDPHRASGVASIVVADDGQNSIVVVPGANDGVDIAQVQASGGLLRSAKVVVVQLEIPWPAAAEALRSARQAGATTVLNAAPALTLGDEALGSVDWLVVNESEAAHLVGHEATRLADASRAAATLSSRGPGHVVLTLGSAGLVHASAAGAVHLGAFEVASVDSTGAGDTFVGALAAALADGADAASALRFAQAAAALSTTRRGSQSAMPTRAEVVAHWGDTALAAPGAPA